MRAALLPFSAAFAIAGCTAPDRVVKAPPPATPVPAAATSAATTRDCVELRQIREARVINDRTIDFHLLGGDVLRNTLPYSCPSLGFEKAFTYSTSISRLCSVDIITVIYQGGGPRTGASCGLGKFASVTPETSQTR